MRYRHLVLAVLEYRSESGHIPVREFVDALPVDQRDDYYAMVRDLTANDLDASVNTRQIKGKLWELKVAQNRYFYVLFTVLADKFLIILHAYRKQSQKAPKREIEVATKRMQRQLKIAEALLRDAERKQKTRG